MLCKHSYRIYLPNTAKIKLAVNNSIPSIRCYNRLIRFYHFWSFLNSVSYILYCYSSQSHPFKDVNRPLFRVGMYADVSKCDVYLNSAHAAYRYKLIYQREIYVTRQKAKRQQYKQKGFHNQKK